MTQQQQGIWAPVIAYSYSKIKKSELWVLAGLRQYGCQITYERRRRVKVFLSKAYISEFGKEYIFATLVPAMPKLKGLIKDTIADLEKHGHANVVTSIVTKVKH